MSKRVYRQDTTGTYTIHVGSDMVAASVITPQPFEGYLPASARKLRKRIQNAVKQGDRQKAITLLNRLIMQPGAKAEDFNNRGLLHMWNGHLHKAIRDFNRAIALNPELAAAYNNRANYYAAMGNEKKALADYEYTIDLNPFHVRARINRGVTLRKLGNFDVALEAFDEALLFHQFEAEAYAERGRTFHVRGDWNCAIADYRRSLKAISESAGNSSSKERSRQYQVMTWLSELCSAA